MANIAHTLYELLCANTVQILVRDPTPQFARPAGEPASGESPAGGLCGRRGHAALSAAQLSRLPAAAGVFHLSRQVLLLRPDRAGEVWPRGFKNRFELVFLLSPFEQAERRQVLELGVSANTFRINCTPIVNLFPQTAEPILLDQRSYEYPVIPDVRRPQATEVFSVDEVVSVNPQSNEVMHFEPFYSYRHATLRDKKQTFWLAHHRAVSQKRG